MIAIRKVLHLFVRDLNSSFVVALIKMGRTRKPSRGSGMANKVEHKLVINERFTGPIRTDPTKHTMLNGIPFRGPRR